MDVIKKNQEFDVNNRAYICDLHFDPKYINRSTKMCKLRKNAVPNIG